MKRLIVFSAIAVMVLVGCGGGGGGIGTNANATLPSILNAGVNKNVFIQNIGGVGSTSFSNFTGEITVSGNLISLTANGKNQVFVGATMQVYEN